MSVRITHVQEVQNVKIHMVAISVKILTNAPQTIIGAVVNRTVKIQAVLIFANANKDIKAMEKADEDVKILTSAKRMYARMVLVVSIRGGVTDVMILMNVQMEHISVIKMLSVKTPMRDTCVLAIMVTKEMERLVMTLMNV